MRALLLALPLAFSLFAAAPAFADARSNVQAAKKFEKRGEWRRALEAWKAAYSADVNAEYLIGIGDCYVHLGNREEAKKSYNAYLADPLALPSNVEKVKAKIAALEAPAGGLALPGPGLVLPGTDAPPPLPGASAPLPLPGLDLPGAAVSAAEKKGKHKKGSEATLPPLDVQVAEKKAEPGLTLPGPGLDLPAASAPAKKEPEKKVAAASPALELPGLPGPAATPPAPRVEKKEQPAVAISTPPPAATHGSKDSGKVVAVATPIKPEPRHAPEAAVAVTPAPRQVSDSSGTTKVVAYVAAGVALVALGGGAFAYTQASSNHSDLTSKVHDGATAQSLLESESKNKTLSFVGLAGGLVAAGIATALFVF